MSKLRFEVFRRKALQAGAVAMFIGTAMAQTAGVPPRSHTFGAVSVGDSESIRINVADTSIDAKIAGYDGAAVDRTVGIALVDGDGNVVKQMVVTLSAGKTVTLEVSGQELRSRLSPEQARNPRVRPLVFSPPDPYRTSPPGPYITEVPPGPSKAATTVEVTDATSGRTLRVIPAIPPDPYLPAATK